LQHYCEGVGRLDLSLEGECSECLRKIVMLLILHTNIDLKLVRATT